MDDGLDVLLVVAEAAAVYGNAAVMPFERMGFNAQPHLVMAVKEGPACTGFLCFNAVDENPHLVDDKHLQMTVLALMVFPPERSVDSPGIDFRLRDPAAERLIVQGEGNKRTGFRRCPLVRRRHLQTDGKLHDSLIFRQQVGDPVFNIPVMEPEDLRVQMLRIGENPGIIFLRKHLQGGRFVRIEQAGLERCVALTFSCTDELGEVAEKRLVAELMGRTSNLILVGPDGRVIDCLRRVDLTMSERRPVLPGLPGFSGGLVGWFGFECIDYIEPRLARDPLPDELGTPDILLMQSAMIDNMAVSPSSYRMSLYKSSSLLIPVSLVVFIS